MGTLGCQRLASSEAYASQQTNIEAGGNHKIVGRPTKRTNGWICRQWLSDHHSTKYCRLHISPYTFKAFYYRFCKCRESRALLSNTRCCKGLPQYSGPTSGMQRAYNGPTSGIQRAHVGPAASPHRAYIGPALFPPFTVSTCPLLLRPLPTSGLQRAYILHTAGLQRPTLPAPFTASP